MPTEETQASQGDTQSAGAEGQAGGEDKLAAALEQIQKLQGRLDAADAEKAEAARLAREDEAKRKGELDKLYKEELEKERARAKGLEDQISQRDAKAKRDKVLAELAKQSGKSNLDLLDSILSMAEKKNGVSVDSDTATVLEAMRKLAPEVLGAKPFKGGPREREMDMGDKPEGQAQAERLAHEMSVRLGTRKPAKRRAQSGKRKAKPARKGK